MSRLNCFVLIALLVAAVTGCGDSTPPADSAGVQPDESTGDVATVEDDSQPNKDPVDFQTKSEVAESTEVTESATLKQAIIDVAADLMKEGQPNAEPDAARSQVESAIVQIREDVPEFLMVSAETEKRLQAGNQIQDAAKRIADAEAFLTEYGLQYSGLVGSLLPQHKAGTLNAVRTELLAQLIVADMKKAQDALTN